MIARLPRPEPGLVFRYHYLWARETREPKPAPSKDRPACLVATIDSETEPLFVVILPITHSPPRGGVKGVEIPEGVRRHLGLDEARSWIVVSEYNLDEWPSAGISRVDRGTAFAYGFLPPGLLAKIKEGFLEVVRAGRAKAIRRN